MKKSVACISILFFVTVASAQFRVVTYNVAKCIGDNASLDAVIDAASLDDSHGEALPVSIFLFQEVSQGKEKVLHSLLDKRYFMGTYTNKGELPGAQAMFYDSTQLIEEVASHKDIFTGATRYADRWQLDGIDENKDLSLWIYSMHLKASKGRENTEQREFGVKAILEDISTLPQNSNVIVVGDMNFYTVNELGYQSFVQTLIDPLGTEEWAGQDDAEMHTQSPRKIREGGLTSGGMDDRFDFQFISNSLRDGKGFDIVGGSYHAMGNDGDHYDVAINDGSNTFFADAPDRSTALAQALHDASDHIPVIVDFDFVDEVQEEPSKDTNPIF